MFACVFTVFKKNAMTDEREGMGRDGRAVCKKASQTHCYPIYIIRNYANKTLCWQAITYIATMKTSLNFELAGKWIISLRICLQYNKFYTEAITYWPAIKKNNTLFCICHSSNSRSLFFPPLYNRTVTCALSCLAFLLTYNAGAHK